jgi:hypothetical protein
MYGNRPSETVGYSENKFGAEKDEQKREEETEEKDE